MRLVRERHALVLAHRAGSSLSQAENHATLIDIGEVSQQTDWRKALEGCDTVIHLAGQVPERGVPADTFNNVNDRGTARLVEQVSEKGVRRFIFLSSIFAVANHAENMPVDDMSPPHPASAYGLSKLAAERHVASFARSGGIGVSLRPPLVYCGEAGGNWRLLQRLAASPLPLPFAAIDNRRSFIAIENLVDAIVRVVDAGERAISGAFVVADDRAISLRDILSWLREGMGRPRRLFRLPPAMLRLALNASFRAGQAQSLLGNLQIDASGFRQAYSWSPPVATRDAVLQSGSQFVALCSGAEGVSDAVPVRIKSKRQK